MDVLKEMDVTYDLLGILTAGNQDMGTMGRPSRRLLALTQQKKHGHIRKQFYNEELRVSSLSLSFCKGRVRFFW
jgi:hypothetical protein